MEKMTGKIKDLVLQKMPQKVKLRENVHSGDDVDRTNDFSQGVEYEVFGMSKYKWSGTLSTLCYLLINGEGILVERACEKFVVIE